MELRKDSKLFRICSKFPDGDLYMFTMSIVQCGRYNLTTQASKSFFITEFVHIYVRIQWYIPLMQDPVQTRICP